jgi:hypothetical protein
MAKRKIKPKKHILKIDEIPQEYDFQLIGIQTKEQLYRLVYDFNRIFFTDFALSEDIKVIRKNTKINFENYTTSPNMLGQKMKFLNNEILVPISHPQTLFDTHEAFYLFPELSSLNYLLMLPDTQLNAAVIKQYFITPYPTVWVDVDMKKCHTAFPVFPV